MYTGRIIDRDFVCSTKVNNCRSYLDLSISSVVVYIKKESPSPVLCYSALAIITASGATWATGATAAAAASASFNSRSFIRWWA